MKDIIPNILDTTANSNIIGQRLKFEMKKRGISSAELAKRADVKTSFIYDVISGKSANPSTVKLARVVGVLGISLSYLVNVSEAASARYSATDDYISVPRLNVEMSGTAVGVVSTAADSEPTLFRKTWITDQLRINPSDLRIIYVRGDSMEPSFYHNDLVLVDLAQKSPSSPGFFVLFDGFGLAVKRLEYIAHQQSPRVRVISDNPQYSAYERLVAEISIIGRIVWFSREM